MGCLESVPVHSRKPARVGNQLESNQLESNQLESNQLESKTSTPPQTAKANQ